MHTETPRRGEREGDGGGGAGRPAEAEAEAHRRDGADDHDEHAEARRAARAERDRALGGAPRRQADDDGGERLERQEHARQRRRERHEPRTDHRPRDGEGHRACGGDPTYLWPPTCRRHRSRRTIVTYVAVIRKLSISVKNRSGRSSMSMCPASGTICARAPGMAAASSRVSFGGVIEIVGAAEDQRRRAHLRRCGGAVVPVDGAKVGVRDLLVGGEGDAAPALDHVERRRRRPDHAREPLAEAREVAGELDEDFGRDRQARAAVDEDEPGDALGPRRRRVERHERAHRVAHEHGLLDLQLRADGADGVAVHGDRDVVGRVPAIGLPVSRQVGRHHAPHRREAAHHVHPHHRRRARAVHADEGRAFAFALVANTEIAVSLPVPMRKRRMRRRLYCRISRRP